MKTTMTRNGETLPTHWKLWVCNQETGRDYLHSWGPDEADARAEMQAMAARGRDVWLIAPDGTKHLPSLEAHEWTVGAMDRA